MSGAPQVADLDAGLALTSLTSLARAGVVDLDLELPQLLALGEEAGWTGGATLLLLSRRFWWKQHVSSWAGPWRALVVAAASSGEEGLHELTRAAVIGAVPAVGSSWYASRYQALLVQALDALAEAGLAAPPGTSTAPRQPSPPASQRMPVTSDARGAKP